MELFWEINAERMAVLMATHDLELVRQLRAARVLELDNGRLVYDSQQRGLRPALYALREALAAFRRAPVLTGLSSAMVGLALFVVGLFGLATYNLHLALSAIEERVEIVVYLRDDARQSEIDLAQKELGGAGRGRAGATTSPSATPWRGRSRSSRSSPTSSPPRG